MTIFQTAPKCTSTQMYIFPNDNFPSGNLGNGTDCSLTKNTKKGTERNVDRIIGKQKNKIRMI